MPVTVLGPGDIVNNEIVRFCHRVAEQKRLPTPNI